MDENLEKEIEKQAKNLIVKEETKSKTEIDTLIDEKVKNSDNLKSAIDLFATKTALKQEETLNKVVEEKQEELRNDAEAKRVQSETERITKEVEKVKQEKEKKIAELDKEIVAKKKEVEKLNAESDKEQAFFESNKDILKYIGIREKKSTKTMQCLMLPALIVFIVVQVLLFPLTFCGLLLETVMNIIGGVCGAVKNNAAKILLTIFVILLIAVVIFCVYYFGIKYLFA